MIVCLDTEDTVLLVSWPTLLCLGVLDMCGNYILGIERIYTIIYEDKVSLITIYMKSYKYTFNPCIYFKEIKYLYGLYQSKYEKNIE